MKVLMFGWEFPPHISGGLGTACLGITGGLAENDVEVLFVVPKSHGDESTGKIKLLSASEIDVLPVPPEGESKFREVLTYFEVNCPVVPYLSPEAFAGQTNKEVQQATIIPGSGKSSIRYAFSGGYGKDLMKEVWQYALTAAEIAAQQDFDIIHAHDWHSFPAGIMARETSGKPLVVHVHATEFDRSGDNINMQVYETERQGMLKADKIVAVSEFTRHTIITKYHIPAEKVVTIHNAVSLPLAGNNNKMDKCPFPEKIITFIGRVTYQKGPASFIEAARKILERDKGFRFVMGGSGDMLPKMIEKVAQLRISSHFYFTGFLDHGELHRLLSESDVFVMPSVSEPFGLAPLEAISAGVPVIISRQSGVQEVLQYALKIDWWDTDALANAIHALASYRGLSALLSRESAREVTGMKWKTQTNLIKSLYEELLNSYR